MHHHFLKVYMLARSLDNISTKHKNDNNPSLQQLPVSNTNIKRRNNAQQTKELKECIQSKRQHVAFLAGDISMLCL